MSRLIIHVGTHKTGTTSIQAYLAANRDALAASGVLYPDATRFIGRHPEVHHNIATALARSEGAFPEPLLRFREHLRARLADHDAIILSSEQFYRHLIPGERPDDEAELWARRDAYVARMAAYFEPLSPTISVYLRNPVTLAESKFANSMMATVVKADFAAYVGRSGWSYEYGRHVATFRRHFASVEAHSFERAARPNLVAGFFADHGLTPPAIPEDRRMRVSPPNQALLWIQRLKAEGALPDRDRERRWGFALQDAARPLFGGDAPSTLWDSAAARSAFFERYGAPVDTVAFDPPAPELAAPRATWDDARHAAANAAFAAWLPANEARLRRREAAGVLPFEPDDAVGAAPTAAGRPALQTAVARLRKLGRRLAGR